ncbi:MAG: phosphotransferase family protein [Pseudomonadota bacterium]
MAKLDRQAAFSGTRPVSEGVAFSVERLTTYLKEAVDGFQGPCSVSQFKGGQSNPTFLIEAASGRYVLRRKPPGDLLPSAHAVDREYRVMRALADTPFPVPRVYALCEDLTVIGSMFYVMEHLDGRVIWEPHCPGETVENRAAIYDAMNAALATLHGLDPKALGLEDFGRAEGYVARQIGRWSKQYRASETSDINAMNRLMEWLPTVAPQSDGISIVHGDYRLDNMILHRDRPEILAVVDWELSTLGDPLADFTYHCMQWVMPISEDGSGVGSLKGCDLDALSIPTLDTYVSAYCERTGRSGIANLDVYMAYNFFRLAAIFQGIVGRVRDGTAANENAEMIESQVAPIAETAWSFAERAGATR